MFANVKSRTYATNPQRGYRKHPLHPLPDHGFGTKPQVSELRAWVQMMGTDGYRWVQMVRRLVIDLITVSKVKRRAPHFRRKLLDLVRNVLTFS